MPGPLEGTLNALNADPQPSTGLRIPGYRFDNTPQSPQREMGLNDLVGRLASMAGQTTDLPRQMAYNLGPALVGRPGEGPQNGAELFGRLGLDPNSPTQRAIGHGGGAALDMLANPLNLLGMGGRAPGAARPAESGNLIRRLEQHAGQGLGSNLAANPATGSIAGMEQGSLLNPRYSPSMSPFAGRQPFTAAEMAAERATMAPRPATPPPVTPGWDFEALRRQQLNSPSFNPALPVEGLGTPAFSQGPAISMPSPPAASRLDRIAAAARSPAAGEGGLVRQLEQMSPPRSPSGGPGANATSLPNSPWMAEYSPDQFRAFYEAVNNPGRARSAPARRPSQAPSTTKEDAHMMPPQMPPQGGPGLAQLLAQMSPGSMGGMPPGMMGPAPPEASEGEGGSNPLIAILLQLLAGQGGMPQPPMGMGEPSAPMSQGGC